MAQYITVNAAKCLKCGDTIMSTSRHDFVTCSCGNLSVDGGHDYLKRSVRDGQSSYEDCSAAVELTVKPSDK
jgi:hypothetical protein